MLRHRAHQVCSAAQVWSALVLWLGLFFVHCVQLFVVVVLLLVAIVWVLTIVLLVFRVFIFVFLPESAMVFVQLALLELGAFRRVWIVVWVIVIYTITDSGKFLLNCLLFSHSFCVILSHFFSSHDVFSDCLHKCFIVRHLLKSLFDVLNNNQIGEVWT